MRIGYERAAELSNWCLRLRQREMEREPVKNKAGRALAERPERREEGVSGVEGRRWTGTETGEMVSSVSVRSCKEMKRQHEGRGFKDQGPRTRASGRPRNWRVRGAHVLHTAHAPVLHEVS